MVSAVRAFDSPSGVPLGVHLLVAGVAILMIGAVKRRGAGPLCASDAGRGSARSSLSLLLFRRMRHEEGDFDCPRGVPLGFRLIAAGVAFLVIGAVNQRGAGPLCSSDAGWPGGGGTRSGDGFCGRSQVKRSLRGL